MPDYRRWRVPGGTYFFTVVTHQLRRLLTDDLARKCLREAIQTVQQDWPFELFAIVLLPDHLHTVWILPRGDANCPTRCKLIKAEFTRNYLQAGGTELPQSESRDKHGLRGVWQKRYWEHTVEAEDDLKRCVDYVHWNPKKHRHVNRVRDWPWSSFHRFVEQGEYTADWGAADPTPGYDAPERGELR